LTSFCHDYATFDQQELCQKKKIWTKSYECNALRKNEALTKKNLYGNFIHYLVFFAIYWFLLP